jgi:hypothetical protein
VFRCTEKGNLRKEIHFLPGGPLSSFIYVEPLKITPVKIAAAKFFYSPAAGRPCIFNYSTPDSSITKNYTCIFSTGFDLHAAGFTPRITALNPAVSGHAPASPGFTPASSGLTPASPGHTPASSGFTPRITGLSPKVSKDLKVLKVLKVLKAPNPPNKHQTNKTNKQ